MNLRMTTAPDRLLQSLSLCLFLVLAIAGPGSPAAAGQSQQIPGTSISLTPIEGFQPTTAFAGFTNEDGASIFVVQMPAVAYAQISPMLGDLETAKAAFAKQNISVDTLEDLPMANGEKATLVSGTQINAGTAYDKWVAIFKGPVTALVTVQSPDTGKLDPAAVKAMMSTVSIAGPLGLDDQMASLPFTIKPATPFRPTNTIGGVAVVMTAGEKDVDPTLSQPMLIASYEFNQTTNAAIDEAPLRFVIQNETLKNPQIDSNDRVFWVNDGGFLLRGHYDDGRKFQQLMSLDSDGRLLLLFAEAPEAQFDALQPAIDAIAGSIAIKNGN